MMNHYKWLENGNLKDFFEKCGIEIESVRGILSSDGDKAYSYMRQFKNEIHPYHTAAIYLLSTYYPYSKEVRETKNGWVPVDKWIIDNKDRFVPLLNPVDE